MLCIGDVTSRTCFILFIDQSIHFHTFTHDIVKKRDSDSMMPLIFIGRKRYRHTFLEINIDKNTIIFHCCSILFIFHFQFYLSTNKKKLMTNLKSMMVSSVQ